MRVWLAPSARTWITPKWAALWVALLFLIAPVVGNAACQSISATPVVFGNYTGTALSYTATVTAHCDSGYAYYIGIAAGLSNSETSRTMLSGSNVLNYQFYQDAAHTTYWGADPGTNYVSEIGTGANQTFNVYGLLPAGQLVPAGSYADFPIIYLYNTGLFVAFYPTATVVANCTVSATAINFGNYTGTLINNNPFLTVTCTNATPFNIGLNAGMGSGATTSTRVMTGPGGATLSYAIFQDAGHTIVWGNVVGTDTMAGTGTGAAVQYRPFGRLSGGQAPTPGSYSDTITVTITY